MNSLVDKCLEIIVRKYFERNENEEFPINLACEFSEIPYTLYPKIRSLLIDYLDNHRTSRRVRISLSMEHLEDLQYISGKTHIQDKDRLINIIMNDRTLHREVVQYLGKMSNLVH